MLYNANARSPKRPDDFMPEAYQDKSEKLPKSSPEAFKKAIERAKKFEDDKAVKREVVI